MKKPSIFAAVVLVVGTAGAAFGQTQIECIGARGTLDCPQSSRVYTYLVTPAVAETDIYIGTDDGNIDHYIGICAPPGWTMTIEPSGSGLGGPIQHWPGMTPDWLVSPGPAGTCEYQMHWSGPIMTRPFELGFDAFVNSHDVGWYALLGMVGEDWAAPVGMGSGPVHGLKSSESDIPTLTDWGLILVALLLVTAGTLLLVRRRRAF